MHVANKKTHIESRYDVYVGRPSVLGNQWTHRPEVAAKYKWMTLVATREDAVAYYKQWLWTQIKIQNKEVMAALRALNKDTVLVCWCSPLACHGDVIKAAWGWMEAQKL